VDLVVAGPGADLQDAVADAGSSWPSITVIRIDKSV
jgi:hypothetical protein